MSRHAMVRVASDALDVAHSATATARAAARATELHTANLVMEMTAEDYLKITVGGNSGIGALAFAEMRFNSHPLLEATKRVRLTRNRVHAHDADGGEPSCLVCGDALVERRTGPCPRSTVMCSTSRCWFVCFVLVSVVR